MVIVGWLGIALAAWLLDAAVTGRAPLTTLKTILETGAIPPKPAKTGVGAVIGTPTNPGPGSENGGGGGNTQGPQKSGPGSENGGGGGNTTPVNQTAASLTPDNTPWPNPPAPGTYAGNLDGWIAQAGQILEANGYPASQWNPADVALIIQYESGGDPLALNNYDSNAVKGHPSIGLMQTIRSTFNAHALPGHYDIFNPVDNIIAAVRYAQAQYGGLENVPGVISVHNGGPYEPY